MHSSGGVPRKRCSDNMQQIYRRIPMPKFVFNKAAKQLYKLYNCINVRAHLEKNAMIKKLSLILGSVDYKVPSHLTAILQ